MLNRYRVISFSITWESSLGDKEEERYQALEIKINKSYLFGLIKYSYWKELDREKVPKNVWISKGAFGDESTGWKSKFKDYM